MLIMVYDGINLDKILLQFKDDIKYLKFDSNISNESLIKYIEDIKAYSEKYKILFIPYNSTLKLCLNSLNIKYSLLYPDKNNSKYINDESEYIVFENMKKDYNIDAYILHKNESICSCLSRDFEWLVPRCENILINYSLNQNSSDLQDIKNLDSDTNNEKTNTTNNIIDYKIESMNKFDENIDKKNLTLQDVITNDMDLTENDVRDVKSLTNKFKVTMLLQAKSRLKTVLKLCNILDKLYDELINRVDESLEISDTASLMYTTDYLSKALNETNQFIMSLITNEKIQNFFIIENSNIINISENKVDIDKREKIRKAAEIVLENTDYFTSGQYDKVINPNVVFDDKENKNANI